MTDLTITPPPELVRQWLLEYYGGDLGEVSPEEMYVARCAAQWGADQELEACLAEVSFLNSRALAERVRDNRRRDDG